MDPQVIPFPDLRRVGGAYARRTPVYAARAARAVRYVLADGEVVVAPAMSWLCQDPVSGRVFVLDDETFHRTYVYITRSHS